ncbi:MAG TPA: hypothetical protein VJM11_04450, partial [Nevskiaceae bacterium]|nr:hypothetical protein [Nevskiaceae bacterium]
MGYRGDTVRYIFQSDGGLLLLLTAPPAAEVRRWKGDLRGGALADLGKDPLTRAIADANAPVGKGVGLLKSEFFYRRASGPGWALVGDAGNTKDFVTGHGMTEAFLGARALHAAILEGGDVALERYWRERDVRSMPWFFEALRMGHVTVNDAFNRMIGRGLAEDGVSARRMVEAADRKLSPFEVFPIGRLLRMVGGELLRGQFDVLPAFLRAGRQLRGYEAILAERTTLLQALPPRAASPATVAGTGAFRAMPHGVH